MATAQTSPTGGHVLAGNVLLSALDPTGRAWDGLSGLDWSTLPWPWMIDRARHHKILTILMWRLRSAELEGHLPDGVRETLEAERRQVEERIGHAERTLSMLTDIAREIDGAFFLVKGALLAQEVFGDPALRVYSDVDIVVPQEQVDTFDRALRKHGYYFWAPPRIHRFLPRRFIRAAPPGEARGSKEEARRVMATYHRHYVYVLQKGDPRLQVELHWHVFVPGDSSASEADLWQRTTRATIGGVELDVFDPEATLLHCAAHALEGGPEKHRLLHLADVLWIIHRWGADMDPAALDELARRWGVGRQLTAALEGARSVFPFELPPVTESLWPRRSRWSRRALASAGLGPGVVDRGPDTAGIRGLRFVSATWADALWELSWGHPPVEAWQRVRRLVITRLGSPQPEPVWKRDSA